MSEEINRNLGSCLIAARRHNYIKPLYRP